MSFHTSLVGRIDRSLILIVALDILVVLFGSGLTENCADVAQAQVTTSITPTTGTGNLGTAVSQAGTLYNITGGTRTGTNLFHSFGNFTVGPGNTANFLNTPINGSLPSTSNILARVTGGNISQIFGTIQTTGFGNANLFLMNPTGFLFGPNATVNVGGMVTFTSADYMRLADGGRFNANPNTIPADILTPAPVAAFGFLGSNPGAITVQGSQLTVTEGTGISLVGGNITVQSGALEDGTVQSARLSAPGGQMNLASVASPGEILLANLQSAPNINGQSLSAMGNINLSQGTVLDVSGNSGGTVRIRGGSLVMDAATISADSIDANGTPVAIDVNVTGNVSISAVDAPALTARTTGAGNAGEIRISSGSIDVMSIYDQGFFAAIDTHTSGSGNAGNLNITSDSLTVADNLGGGGIFIDSGMSGPAPGHGGDVTISVKSMEFMGNILTGNLVAFFNDEGGVGTAGNVTINADHLQMTGANIVTDVTDFMNFGGKSGAISITAHDMTLDGSSFSSSGGGGSGNITITADQLIATTSGIQAITTSGPGGEIRITGNVIELRRGTTIVSSTNGDGNAGAIIINATDHLGIIESFDFGPFTQVGGLFTNSFGDQGGNHGNAGDVVINTPSLQLTGGTRIDTTTASSGRGGNVTINASSIAMSGEAAGLNDDATFNLGSIQSSGIYSRTVGGNCTGLCGSAGNISITTGSLTMGTGAQINNGTSSSGQGGSITINATDTISFSGTLSTGQPGGIQSRSAGADPDAGAGGTISLTAGQAVNISDGASVSASTSGPGNAGNILAKANDIALSGGGTITAASNRAGNAGTVTIQGLNNPANSLLIDGADSGVFTTTSSTGTGGNIAVDANAVNLTNGASITASSTGPGSTGNIQITAGNQFAMTNSTVTTEALHSSGGAIKITTNPDGSVQLTNSTISASVLDGTGGGGSVNIDPQYVVLQNSQIIANAVSGPGGNIFITTNLLLPDAYSTISASSQFGQQGTVIIQSPVAPASGKINPIGQKPLIATSLVNQRCAALAGGTASSFTIAGRDTLPAEPGGWLSTPLALEGEGLSGFSGLSGSFSQIDQTNESVLLSLRKIAPAGFLTQTFAPSQDCTTNG